MLRQITLELELSKQVVGCPELPGEIQRLKIALLGEDGFYLYRERLVPRLLMIEELGALGSIVDNLRDL